MKFHIRPIKATDASFTNDIRIMEGVMENILSIPSERVANSEKFFANLTNDDHLFVAECMDSCSTCQRRGHNTAVQRPDTIAQSACQADVYWCDWSLIRQQQRHAECRAGNVDILVNFYWEERRRAVSLAREYSRCCDRIFRPTSRPPHLAKPQRPIPTTLASAFRSFQF